MSIDYEAVLAYGKEFEYACKVVGFLTELDITNRIRVVKE